MAAKQPIAVLAEASGRDLSADAALATTLDAVVAQARTAWPQLTVDETEFVAYVARHVGGERELGAALRTLHAGDLYLAHACSQGNEAAVAIFDREFLSRIPAVIARVERAPANVEEIAQSVRVSVLTGEPPRIVQYSGRGPLSGWLRAVALNAALMAQRGRREVLQSSVNISDRAAAGPLDPELQMVRDRHRPQFQAALDAALQALTVRERTLLRAYFVDDMTIDDLGELFRVHRATAARWLQAAHVRLLDETRRRVMERVPLTASEFDSLAALLKSELSLTFSALKQG
jgi:RNA polymerase sigma-70 factor (ECF subfamily)